MTTKLDVFIQFSQQEELVGQLVLVDRKTITPQLIMSFAIHLFAYTQIMTIFVLTIPRTPLIQAQFARLFFA